MWTDENRKRYDRSRLRYPSDLTDDEWGLVAPLIPPAKRGGNRRHVNVREVMNGIMYVLSTGCQWRAVPKDLPPRSTLFTISTCGVGTGRSIAFIMYFMSRAAERTPERQARPPRSSTARASRARKKGPRIDPHGYDAGKKIKGKKRHVLVDTQGLLLYANVHSAGIQDRDGGLLLLATLFGMYPFLKTLFADGGYQGPEFRKGLAKLLPYLQPEFVKRADRAKGFVLLPKRWIVERSIAWLNRCRRLAKDWENLNRKALAFLSLAPVAYPVDSGDGHNGSRSRFEAP